MKTLAHQPGVGRPVEDMDLEFRDLLPEEPMEEGGEWDIPLSFYDSLLNPIGIEPVDSENDEEPEVETEGEFTATFEEVVEIEKAEATEKAE